LKSRGIVNDIFNDLEQQLFTKGYSAEKNPEIFDILDAERKQMISDVKEKIYQIPFLVKSRSYPEQQPPFRVNLVDMIGKRRK
jgi:hypothetical protein